MVGQCRACLCLFPVLMPPLTALPERRWIPDRGSACFSATKTAKLRPGFCLRLFFFSSPFPTPPHRALCVQKACKRQWKTEERKKEGRDTGQDARTVEQQREASGHAAWRQEQRALLEGMPAWPWHALFLVLILVLFHSRASSSAAAVTSLDGQDSAGRGLPRQAWHTGTGMHRQMPQPNASHMLQI